MPATLVARPCDPQAAKVTASANASKAELQVFAWTQAKKLSEGDFAPFSRKTCALLLEDGSVLGDANAMARYAYLSGREREEASLLSIECESWIEWEETVLRPAMYGHGNLTEAVGALEKGLEGARLLSGGPGLGLEDIIVACTLRSGKLLGVDLKSAAVEEYLARCMNEECMRKGVEQAGVSKGDDEIEAALVAGSDARADREAEKKLPRAGERNILITSALPYVNNVPHLGNIIGCVLSADVYARFCRSRGYNCIYVCGTDEYGTATETRAIEEGLSCQALCDKYNAVHESIYDWFDIKFDNFGRTPTRYQTKIAQDMFHRLRENGFLQEKTIEQLYSEPLNKFLADRYVTGTCPKCAYEDARGDQCDGCGGLLNPTELKNPKCALTGSTPVLKSTNHVFLDLPALEKDLSKYIEVSSEAGGWSANCMSVTKAWLSQGLKPRCISRDLKWGTPVPLDGFRDKVFYVWFDAPIGYISITAGYCGDDWKAWWMPGEYFGSSEETPDVEMVQFMGKDNVPFHTIIFPACQIGTKQAWTMMDSISVTEYLNYEDGKFSKSRGIGVFGNDAKDTNIPVEVWRYYLLSMRPENQDAVFQWDDFAAKNNADLNDNLGNFINRTLKFVFARFEGRVPGVCGSASSSNSEVGMKLEEYGKKVSELVKEYIDLLERKKMKQALSTAMHVSKAGNLFFQETEVWKVIKENKDAAAAYISTCFGTVVVLASLLEPFMPSFTIKVLEQANLSSPLALGDDLILKALDIGTLVPQGHRLLKDPTPIFRKITEDEVQSFRERFSGMQADRTQEDVEKAKSESDDKKKEGKKTGGKKPNPDPKNASAKKGAGANDVASKLKNMNINDKIDISRVDIRVGKIVECAKHPDADTLYVEKIDLGEAEPRTVVSGLVKYVPLDQMQNRKVAVVCNLKPANMRGIKSHAMVLAATSSDGSKVELLDPPADAQIGEKISCEGFDGVPDEVLNPKKKVWDQVVPDLSTSDDLLACFRGVPLCCASGSCTVTSIRKGSIK
jgi:methionyl-tRNA synthetase